MSIQATYDPVAGLPLTASSLDVGLPITTTTEDWKHPTKELQCWRCFHSTIFPVSSIVCEINVMLNDVSSIVCEMLNVKKQKNEMCSNVRKKKENESRLCTRLCSSDCFSACTASPFSPSESSFRSGDLKLPWVL